MSGLSGPGIGRGQLLAALFGVLLVAGSLVRDVRAAWRTVAVILLNTIALAVLLELAATGVYRLRAGEARPVPGRGADPHLPLLEQMRANYAPYVVWRELPHAEPGFTIGEDGRRSVTGASEDPEAYEVFMFGGSTMIGWGVPDSLTIPSIMQNRLSCSMSVPVRVVNFGQQAYVGTQELIELMLQLRNGQTPDLVIFYDGINDTFSALQSGMPGMHQNLEDIAGRYAGAAPPAPLWRALAEKSNFVRLVSGLLDQQETGDSIPTWAGGDSRVDVGRLSEGIISVYSGNCRIVRALGDEYGFASAFFWQPYLGSGGGRVLSPAERNVAEEMEDGDLTPLLESTYSRASALEGSVPGFADISGCLDMAAGEYFVFGDFCHINAEGNRIVVETMIDSLVSDGAIPDWLFLEPAGEPAPR